MYAMNTASRRCNNATLATAGSSNWQQQLVHRAEPARFDLVNFNYNLRCVSVCVQVYMCVCVSKSSTRRLPLGKAWHRKYVNHNKRHLPCLPPLSSPFRTPCPSAESSSALAVALLLGSAASLVLGTHKARVLAAANRKLKISARLHIKKFLSPSLSFCFSFSARQYFYICIYIYLASCCSFANLLLLPRPLLLYFLYAFV